MYVAGKGIFIRIPLPCDRPVAAPYLKGPLYALRRGGHLGVMELVAAQGAPASEEGAVPPLYGDLPVAEGGPLIAHPRTPREYPGAGPSPAIHVLDGLTEVHEPAALRVDWQAREGRSFYVVPHGTRP